MKDKFKFLRTGYFCYPLKDKDKKFEVINTLTLYYKEKKFIELLKKIKSIDTYPFYILGEVIWKAIKKEKLDKKYKNYWLVPIRLDILDKNTIMIDIDILKPVK